MATLPNWLKSADPASFYAEGTRLGQADAARASAEADRADAAARDQQQLQMRQQQLEVQATAAARKYQAQQGYQQALQQGVDPTQALLKFGPMMGTGAAVGSALTAQRLAAKPPLAPPAIQMMPGPNGTQIPVLMHGNSATVVPRTAFQTPAAPEQFKPATRQINGHDVPGQESSKTGRFIPYPAGDREGAVTPQQRLQISAAQSKKTALEKTLADDFQLLALAKKRAGGKTPTAADRDAVEEGLRAQADELDGQIEQLTGGLGGGAAQKSAADLPYAPSASERKKGQTYMTPRGPHLWNGSSWIVPDDANGNSDSQ